MKRVIGIIEGDINKGGIISIGFDDTDHSTIGVSGKKIKTKRGLGNYP